MSSQLSRIQKFEKALGINKGSEIAVPDELFSVMAEHELKSLIRLSEDDRDKGNLATFIDDMIQKYSKEIEEYELTEEEIFTNKFLEKYSAIELTKMNGQAGESREAAWELFMNRLEEARAERFKTK